MAKCIRIIRSKKLKRLIFKYGDDMDRKILEHYVEYYNNQEGQNYPCSNQIVVCGIITKDKDKAFSVMEKKGAILKRQRFEQVEWELNNERWLWRNWNMNCRGFRFYKMLVDENIDEDLFDYARIFSCSYCCSMEII